MIVSYYKNMSLQFSVQFSINKKTRCLSSSKESICRMFSADPLIRQIKLRCGAQLVSKPVCQWAWCDYVFHLVGNMHLKPELKREKKPTAC